METKFCSDDFEPHVRKEVEERTGGFLTVSELADELKVPKSWVYDKTRRRGENTIPHLRVGKYCRFRLPEVVAWIERAHDQDNP